MVAVENGGQKAVVLGHLLVEERPAPIGAPARVADSSRRQSSAAAGHSASPASPKATKVSRMRDLHARPEMAMKVVSSVTTCGRSSAPLSRLARLRIRRSTGTNEVARASGKCADMRCAASSASSCARDPGSACESSRSIAGRSSEVYS